MSDVVVEIFDVNRKVLCSCGHVFDLKLNQVEGYASITGCPICKQKIYVGD